METRHATFRPPEEWVQHWRVLHRTLAQIRAALETNVRKGDVQEVKHYAAYEQETAFRLADLVAGQVGGMYAAICLENPLAQPAPDHYQTEEAGRLIRVVYTVREPHE